MAGLEGLEVAFEFRAIAISIEKQEVVHQQQGISVVLARVAVEGFLRRRHQLGQMWHGEFLAESPTAVGALFAVGGREFEGRSGKPSERDPTLAIGHATEILCEAFGHPRVRMEAQIRPEQMGDFMEQNVKVAERIEDVAGAHLFQADRFQRYGQLIGTPEVGSDGAGWCAGLAVAFHGREQPDLQLRRARRSSAAVVKG